MKIHNWYISPKNSAVSYTFILFPSFISFYSIFLSVHVIFNTQFCLMFCCFKVFILSFLLSLWLIVCKINVYILHHFMFSPCLSFCLKCPFFKITSFRSVTHTPLPLNHFTFQPFSVLLYFAVSSRAAYSITLKACLLLTLDYTASHPIRV